jgi:hypothetical protein
MPDDKPFPSTSDQRVSNNLMRHNYRPLSDVEKKRMQELKDLGLAFVTALHALGGTTAGAEKQPQGSRELALAQTKMEEAVMWAVKHLRAQDARGL